MERWDGRLYRFLNGLTSNKIDLQEIRKARPRMLILKDGPKPSSLYERIRAQAKEDSTLSASACL